ncbi:MAG: GTPase Era [Actinomycetaceae bacterium]|nr:GTPase Era [Actinomycetaceae bacterium]MDU0970977.1 GTPase Era [Actinomycetaceae bacterium]
MTDFPSDEQMMAGEAAPISPVEVPEGYRAGFVAIVGRPNVGKSTLTNVLVGRKIAITSLRPETTRHNARGVVNREDGQLVLVDTPGLHRPRTLLGKRLNDMARETLVDVDAVVFCLPADQKVGPGDRYIARELADISAPIIAVVTKADLVGPERLAQALVEVSQLGDFAEIIPVSAREEDTNDLVDVLFDKMSPSPPLYPLDQISDQSDEMMIAEYVREAALHGAREELPHSIAVQVEEMMDLPPRTEAQKRGDEPVPLRVIVNIYVERDSQKGIVIGKGGRGIAQIRERATKASRRLLGRPVVLDLHVRTAKNWQRDPKLLGKLGF